MLSSDSLPKSKTKPRSRQNMRCVRRVRQWRDCARPAGHLRSTGVIGICGRLRRLCRHWSLDPSVQRRAVEGTAHRYSEAWQGLQLLYGCGGYHTKGKTVCKGRHIPAARLDHRISGAGSSRTCLKLPSLIECETCVKKATRGIRLSGAPGVVFQSTFAGLNVANPGTGNLAWGSAAAVASDADFWVGLTSKAASIDRVLISSRRSVSRRATCHASATARW